MPKLFLKLTKLNSQRHTAARIGRASALSAIIFALCMTKTFAMGGAPNPDAPTTACINGNAIRDSGIISRCQWANAQTGWNSIRLKINPDIPHSGYHKGQILSAYFSTRLSLCAGQSDTECGGSPADLIGRIIGNGTTFQFKADPNTFMEAKISAYKINGVTHYGLDSCLCR